MQRSHVVVDTVDLVSVHAHETLLSELRAECAVRVGSRDNLCVRDLRSMLRNTDCACKVSHRLLDAISARAKRQKHLAEPEYYLRLIREAVMRRHTLSENLILTTVVVRSVLMCRSDHGYSIACKRSERGRRWSVTCGFSSAGHTLSRIANNCSSSIPHASCRQGSKGVDLVLRVIGLYVLLVGWLFGADSAVTVRDEGRDPSGSCLCRLRGGRGSVGRSVSRQAHLLFL